MTWEGLSRRRWLVEFIKHSPALPGAIWSQRREMWAAFRGRS